mgnify:FL=1
MSPDDRPKRPAIAPEAFDRGVILTLFVASLVAQLCGGIG